MGRAQHSAPAAPASEILLALAATFPEDRLMLAVLLDAVAVLREHATGVCTHDPKLIATTVRWFLVQDEVWSLSFRAVCQALGLDAPQLLTALRTELAELGAPALLKPPRSRVVSLTLVRSAPKDAATRLTQER